MKRSILLTTGMAVLLNTAAATETTFALATELLAERQYPLAAVEFRRFAMNTESPTEAAAAYLYAGYAYLEAGLPEASGEMLDRSESADEASRYASEISLLNAENAYRESAYDSAQYFYDVLAADAAGSPFAAFALRRSAAIELSNGNPAAARERIQQLGRDEEEPLKAIDAYTSGKNKSPVTGGLLGLFPGAGYWYSGEVANGFRSLILNSLFIYGMVDTAQEEQWGAFVIISFFEVTWYSGSIYGGIDAAHRYNHNRLESALQGIESDMKYRPDPAVTTPVFQLNFEF